MGYQDGVIYSKLYELIKKEEPQYPQGNLSKFLKLICAEEEPIIRYDQISGKYSFIDPMYRVFAMAYFKKNKKKGDINSVLDDAIKMMKNKLLEKIRNDLQISNTNVNQK